jgi:hypothetical protein
MPARFPMARRLGHALPSRFMNDEMLAATAKTARSLDSSEIQDTGNQAC